MTPEEQDRIAEPTSVNDEIDTLVAAFLTELSQRKIAGLTFYSFAGADGKAVARMKSNSDPVGTRAAVAWMERIDERVIEAAARVVKQELIAARLQRPHGGGFFDTRTDAETAKLWCRRVAEQVLVVAKAAALGAPVQKPE